MELFAGFAIALLAGVWVYNDARKRGSASALGWAIGTVGLLIVFLPLWLIIRPHYQHHYAPVVKSTIMVAYHFARIVDKDWCGCNSYSGLGPLNCPQRGDIL